MKLLFEATHYNSQAEDMIVKNGLFSHAIAHAIVDGIRKEDIGALKYTKGVNWIEKYIIGIVRMMIDEANGSSGRAVQFLRGYAPTFDYYLTWVRENRNSMPNPVAFDTKFNKEMSYADVLAEVERMQEEEEAESEARLSNMSFGHSDYTLVPITSFNQMNRDYGGPVTGNCEVDEDGNCESDWCHANDRGVFDAWTSGGGKFFVLEKNGWKNIKFDEQSNLRTPKDDYGNSLIAILVDRNGKLRRSTLRSNHVGIPAGKTADQIYRTYADLSEVVGFNVEKEVKKQLGLYESMMKRFARNVSIRMNNK